MLHGNYMLKENTFRDYNRVLVLKHPRIAINDPRIIMNNNMCNSWTITWQLYVKDNNEHGFNRLSGCPPDYFSIGHKKAFPACEERLKQSGRPKSNCKRNSLTWNATRIQGFRPNFMPFSPKLPVLMTIRTWTCRHKCWEFFPSRHVWFASKLRFVWCLDVFWLYLFNHFS